MFVLGIETSCDETSSAVVKDGNLVLSNVVSSSLNLHRRYGGVVPEIASRQQLETITRVTQACLKQAGLNLRKVGLISVTQQPGLLGSLLVGVSFAQALALALDKPLIVVDHLHSHIYANFLNLKSRIKLPFIALVVSGGHTSLFLVKGFSRIRLLGSTSDDACGEAFDKVAKLLGLGYPGGPLIEERAKKGSRRINFRCSETRDPLEFSFSGIKTAVLYYLNRLSPLEAKAQRNDICASFQAAVVDTLVKKSFFACRRQKIQRLLLGGGVAANTALRERFQQAGEETGIKVYFPSRQLCMDNAAMVAGMGYRLFKG